MLTPTELEFMGRKLAVRTAGLGMEDSRCVVPWLLDAEERILALLKAHATVSPNRTFTEEEASAAVKRAIKDLTDVLSDHAERCRKLIYG